jgi:hypothetical protein
VLAGLLQGRECFLVGLEVAHGFIVHGGA